MLPLQPGQPAIYYICKHVAYKIYSFIIELLQIMKVALRASFARTQSSSLHIHIYTHTHIYTLVKYISSNVNYYIYIIKTELCPRKVAEQIIQLSIAFESQFGSSQDCRLSVRCCSSPRCQRSIGRLR